MQFIDNGLIIDTSEFDDTYKIEVLEGIVYVWLKAQYVVPWERNGYDQLWYSGSIV